MADQTKFWKKQRSQARHTESQQADEAAERSAEIHCGMFESLT